MIPKIIHHIWVGKKPFPEKFKEYRESWINLHPGWQFYFWTDQNLPEMPFDVEKVVKEEKYLTSIRSDILRLHLLNLYGGIYVDTDMECLKSFDEFLNFDFFAGKENDKDVCNALMGATKTNNVTHKLLAKCLKNINQYTIELANINSLHVSAVPPLTEFLHNTDLNASNIKIFEYFYFYPSPWYIPSKDIRTKMNLKNSYSVHYWAGHFEDGWASKENQKLIRKLGIINLYKTILQREADEVGLNHYYNLNLNIEELKKIFYNSHEYKKLNKTNFWKNSGIVDLDFLEIGTSDYDTLLQNCSEHQLGISIEPVKHYLNRLPNKNNVKKFNMAISFDDSENPINVYYVTSDIVKSLNLPDWIRGCNSLGGYHVEHKKFNLQNYVKIDSVEQMPIDKFLIKNNIRGINYLKIDVEGGDCFILKKLMQYLKYKQKEYYPNKIMFETNDLTTKTLIEETIKLYCENGYEVVFIGHETILQLKK